MVKGKIIIGANLGDEGKGTVAATYTKHAVGKVLNVLTNGGPQRAHSIVVNGQTFTFKHFGSGTYYGADNYFSETFILNPMQFVKEFKELDERNVYVTTYRNPNCMWTTPYDMMANQIKEELRGSNKHGSCGMGIWETIVRYKHILSISLSSFVQLELAEQLKYLNAIKTYYEKDLTINKEWEEIWNSKFLQLHFIEDCRYLVNTTSTILPTNYDEVIFENGQGLMLCDSGIDLPGTTPSITDSRIGVQAINELLTKGIHCDDVTVHYVTRPYLTRHGKGYLEGETYRHNIAGDIQIDATNHHNKFQDDFRYGTLDINALKQRIELDNHPFKSIIELTHCDEMDRESEFKKLFQLVNTYDSATIK